MTENYIKPEDVSSEVAQKVLDFLNSAKSAKEIADTVGIPNERDVGIIVTQHILDRRKQLGKFTNLQQVADVQQVGPERFTQIVTTLGGGKIGGKVNRAVLSFTIEHYWLALGKNIVDPGNHAYIYCYGTNGDSLRIRAIPMGVPIPKNSITRTSDLYHATLCVPAEEFGWYVDLLQNEKSVCFTIVTDIPDATSLSSGKEPGGTGGPVPCFDSYMSYGYGGYG